MDDDYQIDDCPCPACGNSVTHSRGCSEIQCEDGFLDEYDEDPINFSPGESVLPCEECSGTGIERWCPACGADYWKAKAKKDKRKRPA